MIHPWHDVTPGDKLPEEFNSVIEIIMLKTFLVRASAGTPHDFPRFAL
ncbi:MAG TPA: hypothetical protein VEI26_18325 [Terriglobales bacterium]|nr:hypothetical protein [Terriglobales bacterium]